MEILGMSRAVVIARAASVFVLALSGIIGIYQQELTLVLWSALIVSGLVALWAWFYLPEQNSESLGRITWQSIKAELQALQSRSNKRHKGPVSAVQILRTDKLLTWNIYGSTDAARRGVTQQCALAGAKVRILGLGVTPRVTKEMDDVQRWLWFLVEIGLVTKNDDYFEVTDQWTTEPSHYIHVPDLIAVSIAGCVECIHRGMSTIKP